MRYSKPRNVLMVQTDSLTGETIGAVIQYFYDAGALNVQVVSTITKKNRPGYMIFIDVSPDRIPAVEEVILRETGSTGWHVLNTEHRYVSTEIRKVPCEVYVGEKHFTYEVACKVSDEIPGLVRPEHDCVKALKDILAEEYNLTLSLEFIRESMIRAFSSDDNLMNIHF